MPKLLRNLIIPLAVLAIAGAIALAMVKSRSELPRREQPVSLPLVETVIVDAATPDVDILESLLFNQLPGRNRRTEGRQGVVVEPA